MDVIDIGPPCWTDSDIGLRNQTWFADISSQTNWKSQIHVQIERSIDRSADI